MLNTYTQKAGLFSAIYFLVVLLVSHFHIIGAYETETDFYGVYAAEAQRIWQGESYQYNRHGPGYPFTLGLVNRLLHNIFLAGKILSVLSSALVLFFIFKLFESLFNPKLALLTLLVLMTSHIFIKMSISATTDMFFYLLSVMCLYLIFCKRGTYLSFLWAGGLAGLAYLTRTNGFYLAISLAISMLVINFLRETLKSRVQWTALFLIGFAITSSPGLIINYQRQGNAIETQSYLDTASNYFGSEARSLATEGVLDTADKFQSLKEVLLYDPLHFARHFMRNTAVHFIKSIGRLFVFPMNAFLALGLVILGVAWLKDRKVDPRYVAFGSFLIIPFLIQSLLVWEDRYFLFLIPAYALIIAYGIDFIYSLPGKDYRLEIMHLMRFGSRAMISIGLVLALFNVTRSTIEFITSQPVELIKASEFLRGAARPGESIIARKPHLGFIANLQTLYFPEAKTLNELLEYAQKVGARYVLYSDVEIYMRPQLNILSTPAHAPKWLKPVYHDEKARLIIYRVELSEMTWNDGRLLPVTFN